MTSLDDLRTECRLFARALSGMEADGSLIDAYVRAHSHPSLSAEPSPLDRRLLDVARRSVAGARSADAYAALFHRRGLLRRKLVLVHALLETTASHHRAFEAPPLGRGRALWTLARHGVAGVLRLIVAIPRFALAHRKARSEGGGA